MFLQSSAETDVIDTITKQLKEDGIDRTRDSVIRELFRQNLISIDFYAQLKGECDRNTWSVQLNKGSRDEEIGKFCEHLILDGKLTCLDWVQNVLLEICYAKLHIQKRQQNKPVPIETESKLLDFELFNKDCEDLTVVSPVAYHSLSKFLYSHHLYTAHRDNTGRIPSLQQSSMNSDYYDVRLCITQ